MRKIALFGYASWEYRYVIPGMNDEAMGIWDNALGRMAEKDLAYLRLQWNGYSVKIQVYLETLSKLHDREVAMLALHAIQNL